MAKNLVYLYKRIDIVASYHSKQFQGKLMNQTWENGKKLVLGPILVHLTQIRITIFFKKNLAPWVIR